MTRAIFEMQGGVHDPLSNGSEIEILGNWIIRHLGALGDRTGDVAGLCHPEIEKRDHVDFREVSRRVVDEATHRGPVAVSPAHQEGPHRRLGAGG